MSSTYAQLFKLFYKKICKDLLLFSFGNEYPDSLYRGGDSLLGVMHLVGRAVKSEQESFLVPDCQKYRARGYSKRRSNGIKS